MRRIFEGLLYWHHGVLMLDGEDIADEIACALGLKFEPTGDLAVDD